MTRAAQLAEYAAIRGALALVRALPMAAVEPVTRLLGRVAFAALPGRRAIALDNVRRAFPAFADAEVRAVARGSFASFLLTAFPEVAKLRPRLSSPDARRWLAARAPELEATFAAARRIHEEARGCVFVTPHLGNWELLPDVAGAMGIPLAVVVRPLDNPRLERLLLGSRRDTGHVFVAKRNSLLALQQHLAGGRSVGILPDQATYKGIPVEFFGRPAWTTPVPALLAVVQRRPLVPVACVRTGRLRFGGILGEPIWPRERGSEKAEVVRLTALMSRQMEDAIRACPEQYLWMHNRWKPCAT